MKMTDCKLLFALIMLPQQMQNNQPFNLLPTSRLFHSSSEWEVLLQWRSHGPQEHEDWGRSVQVQHRRGPSGLSWVSARRPGETHGRGQTHSWSSGCLQHHSVDGGRGHGVHRPRHWKAGLLLWTSDHVQWDAAVWKRRLILRGPLWAFELPAGLLRTRAVNWRVRETEITGLHSFSKERTLFYLMG